MKTLLSQFTMTWSTCMKLRPVISSSEYRIKTPHPLAFTLINLNSHKTYTMIHTQSCWLHLGGDVHRFPEERVAGHLGAHHPGHHRPRVDANADLKALAGHVGHHEVLCGVQEVEGHGGDLCCVVLTWCQSRQWGSERHYATEAKIYKIDLMNYRNLLFRS